MGRQRLASVPRAVICAVTAALLVTWPAEPAIAQSISPEAFAELADEFFTAAVVEEPVPGAAVVAVQGDDLVAARGYGVIDDDTTLDVSPRSTLFPALDVSQVLTAAAVLRLAEDGTVGLDRDVNDYLPPGVRVPPTYAEPVTLASLLTQTSGLDGISAGRIAPTAAELEPLGTYLARSSLTRTQPPGEVVRPTQQATTLAGYVVERAAARPFARYVREQFLDPLGMAHSGFTAVESGSVAVGYRVDGGRLERAPVGYHQTLPASGLWSVPTDMAGFIAMLHRGGTGRDGEPVLSRSSVAALLSQQFTNDERLPGVSYGFYEHTENGQDALVVTGTSMGFSSLLLLLPEASFGIYAVYNSEYPPVRDAFVAAFFDRFFPGAAAPARPAPASGSSADPGRYRGSYAVWRDETSFLGVAELLREQRTVSVADDGTLGYDGLRWQAVDDAFFEAIEDPDRHLAFAQDDQGRITYLFEAHDVDDERDLALRRLDWWRTRRGFAVTYGGFALAFGLVLAGAAILRRRSAGHAAGAARAVATVNLLVIVSFPAALLVYDQGTRFDFGVPAAFAFLQVLPLVTAAVAVVDAGVAGSLYGRGRIPPWAAAWPLFVAVVTVGYAMFGGAWNLVGLPAP